MYCGFRSCGAEELRLYCKYSAGGHGDTGYGLWGGVGYEAEVYRQVLSLAGAVAPQFYGTLTDAATGETWLVLQYLVESEPIHRYPESLPLAARWAWASYRKNDWAVVPCRRCRLPRMPCSPARGRGWCGAA